MAIALLDSPKQILGVRLNAAVLAGAMIEGGESGPANFYSANGMNLVHACHSIGKVEKLYASHVECISRHTMLDEDLQTLSKSSLFEERIPI